MIVTTQDTCWGQPRIDGTRIAVFNILDCLWDGMSIEDISEYYNLTIQEVKEAILWTREFIVNNN